MMDILIPSLRCLHTQFHLKTNTTRNTHIRLLWEAWNSSPENFDIICSSVFRYVAHANAFCAENNPIARWRKSRYNQMFPIVPCIMFNLSSKWNENPFMYFLVLILTYTHMPSKIENKSLFPCDPERFSKRYQLSIVSCPSYAENTSTIHSLFYPQYS